MFLEEYILLDCPVKLFSRICDRNHILGAPGIILRDVLFPPIKKFSNGCQDNSKVPRTC